MIWRGDCSRHLEQLFVKSTLIMLGLVLTTFPLSSISVREEYSLKELRLTFFATNVVSIDQKRSVHLEKETNEYLAITLSIYLSSEININLTGKCD